MLPMPQGVEITQFFTQAVPEFMRLLEIIEGSKSILEIGSRYGESLRWFARVCPGARLVSVDLGQCPDNQLPHRTGEWWDDVCASLRDSHDVYQIYGDSHDPEIVAKVKALGPYDFVFIDGDHTLEGCAKDWNNYGVMGKIVAFHDTNCVSDVRAVFNTVSRNKRREVFGEAYGIGVVWNG